MMSSAFPGAAAHSRHATPAWCNSQKRRMLHIHPPPPKIPPATKLFPLLGLVWMFLFPLASLSTWELKQRQTYISENSLQPLSAGISFSSIDMDWVMNFDRKYTRARALLGSCRDRTSRRESIALWIQASMLAFGTGTGRTVGRTTDSFLFRASGGAINVVGLWHTSPRRARRESIVVAVPYLGECSPGAVVSNRHARLTSAALSSISLGMGVVRLLQKQRWLSKDIVLFVVDNRAIDVNDHLKRAGRIAVHDWLIGYHAFRFYRREGKSPQDSTNAACFHAGIIRSAIIVDTDENSVGGCVGDRAIAGLSIAGTRGRLPNLDLLNVATHVAGHPRAGSTKYGSSVVLKDGRLGGSRWAVGVFHRLRTVIHNTHIAGRVNLRGWRPYKQNVASLMKFAAAIMYESPRLHTHFLDFNSDALRLSSFLWEDGAFRAGKINPIRKVESNQLGELVVIPQWRTHYLRIAKMIEGTIRSLSNLDEQLHQSFFLYILPSTGRMVTIGEYAPSLALLVLPVLLFACGLVTGSPLSDSTGYVIINAAKFSRICRHARQHHRAAATTATMACISVGSVFLSCRLQLALLTMMVMFLPWAGTHTVLSGAPATLFPRLWHVREFTGSSVGYGPPKAIFGSVHDVLITLMCLVCTSIFCLHGISGVLIFSSSIISAFLSHLFVGMAMAPPATDFPALVLKLFAQLIFLLGVSGTTDSVVTSDCTFCSWTIRYYQYSSD